MNTEQTTERVAKALRCKEKHFCVDVNCPYHCRGRCNLAFEALAASLLESLTADNTAKDVEIARLKEKIASICIGESAAREEICRKCLRVPCDEDCEWRGPQEAGKESAE